MNDARNTADTLLRFALESMRGAFSPEFRKKVLKIMIDKLVKEHNDLIDSMGEGGVEGDPAPPV